VATRERLIKAQRAEAQALTAVCAAEEILRKACAKRDAILAAAQAVVDDAQSEVEETQAALIRVSGLDRAALLVDADPGELRKVAILERRGETTGSSRRVRRSESD
jgi:hypothetical protein